MKQEYIAGDPGTDYKASYAQSGSTKTQVVWLLPLWAVTFQYSKLKLFCFEEQVESS